MVNGETPTVMLIGIAHDGDVNHSGFFFYPSGQKNIQPGNFFWISKMILLIKIWCTLLLLLSILRLLSCGYSLLHLQFVTYSYAGFLYQGK